MDDNNKRSLAKHFLWYLRVPRQMTPLAILENGYYHLRPRPHRIRHVRFSRQKLSRPSMSKSLTGMRSVWPLAFELGPVHTSGFFRRGWAEHSLRGRIIGGRIRPCEHFHWSLCIARPRRKNLSEKSARVNRASRHLFNAYVNPHWSPNLFHSVAPDQCEIISMAPSMPVNFLDLIAINCICIREHGKL